MYNTYLMHHGIKGQKWGVRRFQNTDGSYTSAGKSRRKKTGLSKQQARNLKDVAQIAGGAAAMYGLYKVANPKGNFAYDLKSKFHSNVNLAKHAKDFVKDVARKKYSKEDLKRMGVDAIFGQGFYDRLHPNDGNANTDPNGPRVKSQQQVRKETAEKYKNTKISMKKAKKIHDEAFEAYRTNPTEETKNALLEAKAQLKAAKAREEKLKEKREKSFRVRVTRKIKKVAKKVPDVRKTIGEKIARSNNRPKRQNDNFNNSSNNSSNSVVSNELAIVPVRHSEFLMHHGVKGMHWGVRRYQNFDGSYTSAGKSRRIKSLKRKSKRNDLNSVIYRRIARNSEYSKIKAEHQKAKANYLENRNEKTLKELRKARNKRIADITAFKVAPKAFLLSSNKVRGRYYRYKD